MIEQIVSYFFAGFIILFSVVDFVLLGGRLYEIYLDSKQNEGGNQ